MTVTAASLTRSKLLVRNVLISIAGQALPLLAAVVTIPLILVGLGTDRFGILTIAWMLVGYFSLFDLGIGRALGQAVAARLGVGHADEIPSVVLTGTVILACLGIAGGLLAAALVPWLAAVLRAPDHLRTETVIALYLLCFGLPFVIISAGFRSVLEAYQRFDLVNVVRIPLGLLNFIGPLAVLPFSQSLVPAVVALVIGRVVSTLAFIFMWRRVASTNGESQFQYSMVSPMLRFGGWATICNIISPLMLTFDRLLLGALVSVAAVAVYATPYEVVTKVWIFSGAVTAVLFPAFAVASAADAGRLRHLFDQGVTSLLIVTFPLLLIVITIAPEALTLWLGADFAIEASPVLQVLAIGVFFSSLALLPFTFLQASGRPDLAAKAQLIELPIYFVAAWWLITTQGALGAALAWSGRLILDALILFSLSGRQLSSGWHTPYKLAAAAAILAAALAGPMVQRELVSRFVTGIITGLAFSVFMWLFVLSEAQRQILRTGRFKSFLISAKS